MRLWVNSVPLVDAWVFQGATAYSGTITLTAGQKYDLKMEYFQGGGGAVAQLAWTYAGQPMAIVPQTQLYPAAYAPNAPTNLTATAGNQSATLSWTPGFYDAAYNVKRSLSPSGPFTTIASGVTTPGYLDTGLINGVSYTYLVTGVSAVGESAPSNTASATPLQGGLAGDGLAAAYYSGDAADFSPENGTPFLTAIDGVINFTVDNPVSYNPQAWDAGVPHDHYTAVWTGQLLAPATGNYTFSTVTDDGVRLSLDTGAGLATLLSNPTYHAPTTDNSGLIALTAGQKYNIRLEFFQGAGGATMQLLWTLPNGTTQIIPQSQLFSRAVNAPDAPKNLTATPKLRTVTLDWDTVQGAAFYYIKRGATANGPFATITTGNTTAHYVDAGLTGGVTYYYVVSAATVSAEGPNSNVVAAALPAGITGRIALEGVGDLTAVSRSAPLGGFEFLFRDPGTLTTRYTATATLSPIRRGSPFGTYFVTGIPAGTYDVAIKGSKNLQVSLPNSVITGNANLPDVLLPAGDANNDNSVDTTDFGILVGAYNGDASVSGSGYDLAADFNFDGVVDTTDFGLLVGQYNNTGSP